MCLTDDSYGLSRLIFSETHILHPNEDYTLSVTCPEINDNAVISLRPFVDFALCKLFGFEMPYMYLKPCKSGHFHHIVSVMRKSLVIEHSKPFNPEFVSEIDFSIPAFGHCHCCQKGYSCKFITEWQTVKSPIRWLISSLFLSS